ncbi:hypothetical protein HDU93_004236, partial [Gonapodya sp. JEL0774]
ERELKKAAKLFGYPASDDQQVWDFANVLRECWPKLDAEGPIGAKRTAEDNQLAMERGRLIEDLKAME